MNFYEEYWKQFENIHFTKFCAVFLILTENIRFSSSKTSEMDEANH